MVTLRARHVSPTTLPSWPGPASQPWLLLSAATLDSAKDSISWWKWGEMSPHGPATSSPSSNPPRPRNLANRGPGTGSGSPALLGRAPWKRTSKSRSFDSYSAVRRPARRLVPFPATPRGNQVLPALIIFCSARHCGGVSNLLCSFLLRPYLYQCGIDMVFCRFCLFLKELLQRNTYLTHTIA